MFRANFILFAVVCVVLSFFLFGCTDQNVTKTGGETTKCPSSLQVCGDGCIPTNAICCETEAVNGYCLQPTTGCGNGTCYDCPEGQVFCGMFCKPKGEACCIGDSCGSQLKTNPYVGTYEFVGVYTYHTNRDCKETDNDLVTKKLTVRATFIPPVRDSKSLTFWDYHTVWVSNLWVDDPDFGTGASGVTPELPENSNDLKYTETILPLLPRDSADPENYGIVDISSQYPDGRRLDPLNKHGFIFYIPTSENKYVTEISFGGPTGYTVSADGKYLSSIPYTSQDPFMTNNTWGAMNPVGSGPLSSSSQTGASKYVFCGPRFVSWTATKVSD